MILKQKSVSPNAVLRLGFVLLLVASLATFFLPRVSGLDEGRVDLVAGFLHGLTIGTLLLGLWMSRRKVGRG
jgi:hypothetical protein